MNCLGKGNHQCHLRKQKGRSFRGKGVSHLSAAQLVKGKTTEGLFRINHVDLTEQRQWKDIVMNRKGPQ